LQEFSQVMTETERQMAANPQSKPTDLACESDGRLLLSTSTIDIYYYRAREMTFILPSHGGWKAESTWALQ